MKRTSTVLIAVLAVIPATLLSAQQAAPAKAQSVAAGLSPETRQKLMESLRKGAAFLSQKQKADGMWENHPGINGMVATAILRQPGVDRAKQLAAAGMTAASARITLLCYPRLFGFVFNPLSVYFCYATDGRLGAIVYEVSNTFRERTSYIIAVDQGIYAPAAQCVSQSCAKEMCVSPFTARHGQYAFHVAAPERNVVVGIALRDATGPILKTHFRGTRRALSDRGLVAMLVRHPLMTIKVFAAIHFEAARLWIKGVPLVRRRQSAEHAVHVVGSVTRTSVHA